MKRIDIRYQCCFVILHYKTIDETRNCVISLRNLNRAERNAIVIVDNSYLVSDTGKALVMEYGGVKNIFFVTNKENSFFSYGNNLGYNYAKELGAEFIVVTNSDTLFPQKDFNRKLKRVMERHRFFVCGPNIIEPITGSGTSPISWECLTAEETIRDIRHYRDECDRLRAGDMEGLPKQFKRRLPRLLVPVRNLQLELKKRYIYKKNRYPVLQGSCLIVSMLYIQMNDKMFYPETELYGEEQLLTYRCRKEGFKILYSGDLKVIHKGSVSVAGEISDIKKRAIANYEKIIKAREVYLEYINKKE